MHFYKNFNTEDVAMVGRGRDDGWTSYLYKVGFSDASINILGKLTSALFLYTHPCEGFL